MSIEQDMATVRDVTYDLLRKLRLTTIFGNPGSTEESFLQNFPKDFRYILGLHEATVISMADGYSQALRRPALVNVHTAAGMGNLMANLTTAFQNKTPLIVTAGQQTRKMLLLEPWLTNVDATRMPRPWVKWSYEPKQAQDVPAAIMRAYAMALQPPQGPVFLSIPLDDWDEEAEGEAVVRTVSRRSAPDIQRLADFAHRINASKHPVLVVGAALDKTETIGEGWRAAVSLAEHLGIPVYAAPGSERASFPQSHPQYQGALPFAIKPLSDTLKGHDLILVAGAPVFRYYPYVPGDYLPKGAELLHLTDDPDEAARAPVGDSLLAAPELALEQLAQMTKERRPDFEKRKEKSVESPSGNDGATKFLAPEQFFSLLASIAPEHGIVVGESASNMKALAKAWKMNEPQSYFTFASGILGFGLPAAVGIALAQKDLETTAKGAVRSVTALIGDGSINYTIQALWTAAQLQLPLVVFVLRNEQYAILKSFAEEENTPHVPGLDLPGIDFVALAHGYGVDAHRVTTAEDIREVYINALHSPRPTLIEVAISHEVLPLLS